MAPPLVRAALVTGLVPHDGPPSFGDQTAEVSPLVPMTTLSFVVFLAQVSAQVAEMRVDYWRGITLAVVGAVVGRTPVSPAPTRRQGVIWMATP